MIFEFEKHGENKDVYFAEGSCVTDISEDIIEAARDCWITVPAQVPHFASEDECILAIARAIQSERERCAKIVGSLATRYQKESDDALDDMERLVMFNIAEIVAASAVAIRTPRISHTVISEAES